MKEYYELIKRISKISTPIIYDAIEKFGVRKKTDGYTDSTIKSIIPSQGILCGYACTAKIIGVLPETEGEKIISSKEVWNYVNRSIRPSVMVVQDLDDEPRRACAWGDFSASIYKALGCEGVVSNGYVRDIHEVEKIGFKLFAKSTIAGHGNIRFIEINTPVKIGSLIVNPGDIIHADIHGVITIPKEIDLKELLKIARAWVSSEKKVIDYCKSNNFNFKGLLEEVSKHNNRLMGHFK